MLNMPPENIFLAHQNHLSQLQVKLLGQTAKHMYSSCANMCSCATLAIHVGVCTYKTNAHFKKNSESQNKQIYHRAFS